MANTNYKLSQPRGFGNKQTTSNFPFMNVHRVDENFASATALSNPKYLMNQKAEGRKGHTSAQFFTKRAKSNLKLKGQYMKNSQSKEMISFT